MPRPFTPLETRFLAKVEQNENYFGECWNWLGSKIEDGYGKILTYENPQSPMGYAHRVSYQLYRGTIPEGFTIDHLCKNTSCVNPDHLEAVTNQENNLRGNSLSSLNAKKTHCIRGHPFDQKNTRILSSGKRSCRACDRLAHNPSGRTRSQAMKDRWQLIHSVDFPRSEIAN